MGLGAGIGALAGGGEAGLTSLAPAMMGVEGPLMEGGGFLSQPVGAVMGGAQSGYQMGSMADELLGTGQKTPTAAPDLPAAPAKKPLIPTNPTSGYAVSSALNQLPPELRQQFQLLFQGA